MSFIKTLFTIFAALLITTDVSAEPKRVAAATFPIGLWGFWWGESIASAKTKCNEFILSKDKKYAKCQSVKRSEATDNNGYYVHLGFSGNGLLNTILWDITTQEYDQCIEECIEAIGPSARSEYKGKELWGFMYTNTTGKPIGSLSCNKRFEGCDKDPDSCIPIIMYIKN